MINRASAPMWSNARISAAPPKRPEKNAPKIVADLVAWVRFIFTFFPRGRDPDFLYTKFSRGRDPDFLLHKLCGAFLLPPQGASAWVVDNNATTNNNQAKPVEL